MKIECYRLIWAFSLSHLRKTFGQLTAYTFKSIWFISIQSYMLFLSLKIKTITFKTTVPFVVKVGWQGPNSAQDTFL